ncbi:MAG: cation:proton antiporter, partial [Gammaproteobacteria bacterium]
MQENILIYVVILLAVAVTVVVLLRRLRLPTIIAYLVTGLLIGPHSLNLFPDNDAIRVLAEFGVVFLLFTLGLEFSLPRLVIMRREVLVLGGAQVAV